MSLTPSNAKSRSSKQAFPQSAHSRQSADWSHSTNFYSAAFSRPSRISSSTFAVTSVDVPDFDMADLAENESAAPDSESFPSTTASLSRQNSLAHIDVGELDAIANSSTATNEQEQTTSKLRIAQRETRQIYFLRALTLAIFAMAATFISVAININLRGYQEDLFEEAYRAQAYEIIHTMEERLTNLMTGTEQWSFPYQDEESFTSHHPQFQERAQSMLQSTKATWVGVAPLVSNANRSEWEINSQEKANLWLDDAETLLVSPVIVPETNSVAELVDYAIPLWQHAPTQSEFVNRDFLTSSSIPPRELFLSLEISPPTIVLGNFIQTSEIWKSSTQNNQEKSVHRESMLYLPVLDVREGRSGDVRGVVLASLNWTDFVQSTPSLDESAEGIVCILSNSCTGTGKEQAYRVKVRRDGSGTYMEALDDTPESGQLMMDLEETLDITDFMNVLTSEVLATPLSFQQDYCSYSFSVFASTTVRDYHRTRRPAFYTGGIVGVFLFCSIVFLTYDCIVERRQKKVMRSAVKTHEIVAGLFPETVRRRMFGDSLYAKKSGPEKEDGKVDKLSRKEKKKEKKAMKALNRSYSTQGGHPNGGHDEFVSPRRPNIINSDVDASERNGTVESRPGSKPIADLFPNTTVMFADIAGFTAWSSVRDPSQVFTLLETIYAAFDKLAAQRSVFKVETIGDCYVAVTGLPQPQEDHAVRMVKFARDCLRMMERLTQRLEVELGPDTGDLNIRVGLHSGPVTAGVLRGQKSRFQLFGDTVNTASRMESNGLPNQIQCSQQTADLLIEAKKNSWIHPRKDMVHAKGKGLIQTYWVIATQPLSTSGSNRSLGVSGRSGRSTDFDDQSDITEEPLDNIYTPPPTGRPENSDISPHLQRLIDWNVDTLSQIIKTIMASRQWRENSKSKDRRVLSHMDSLRHIAPESSQTLQAANTSIAKGSTSIVSDTSKTRKSITLSVNNNPRDEYAEAIKMPHFDPSKKVKRTSDLREIELDEVVTKQLRDYITTIACAYNDHPFHNFEHASHVCMSANKILKRVVDAEHVKVRRSSLDNLASKLHNYTYGITSDPLTHFACLFSALIHDVDHPGTSNAQMLKEKHPLAEVYEGKSIAEQNSFDFSWELLMDPDFESLRMCLFEKEDEIKRFRQLVINSIMATDVFDPQLVALRNERWQKAFPSYENGDGISTQQVPVLSEDDEMDLKATVVIEHIIQASDVAHTMQHCYQKWNRRLFEEMYNAYRDGKSPTDPAKSWYQGELWFYDNYIIPLAKKLKECRVFGASSDEFLTYALDNRSEWETKGKAIVEDLVESCMEQSEEFMLNQISRRHSQSRRSSTKKNKR